MSKAAALMQQTLTLDRHVHIKLLGDSITHGVGGTGFAMTGEDILSNMSRTMARNPDGYCWAKLFKEHMEGHYDCTVTNNAISGIELQFLLNHFHELVYDRDDLIICTIGTNDRHQHFSYGPKRTYEQQRQYVYDRIVQLHDKLTATGKDFILLANIPAAASDEVDGEDYWRIIHMEDINELYKKAVAEFDFPFISMYDLFSAYCAEKQLAVDSLLADGLHPNDDGYRVMYDLIMHALGLD